MKFIKKKLDGLDGTIVVFSADSGDFQVIASRKGISFQGRSEPVNHLEMLRNFASVIDMAFKEHKLLLPKIERPDGFKVH